MNKLLNSIKTNTIILLCAVVTILVINDISQAHNYQDAINYASVWAMKNPGERNPAYDDEGDYDCANFVSQCLISGGMDLQQDDIIPSWIFGKGGTIKNCDYLHQHLDDFQHAEVSTGTSANQAPANLKPGDVIIFGSISDRYKHAVIVVNGNGSNVGLAAHSANHNGEVGINYFISQYPEITFYHFPTSSERGHNQEFYGTGRYYGPSTLILNVLGTMMNYEGYIVDCGDVSEQDLVVGEDTSQYSGCAHYIKGYCSDAHEGIPSRGVTFGQPWTSNDPNHWAYWARRAVQYANQNGYSSSNTLSAIWYITDRSGYYNDILGGIGYSQDGPDKNITGYQESIEKNTIKLINNKFNPMRNESVNIIYNITSGGAVTIKIYTIEGTLVKTVLSGVSTQAGTYTQTWNGRNDQWGIVASGIYLVHIEGPGLKDTKKICIIK